MRFKYPASAQSSIVGRCCDAKLPIDLATEHGHWEVFRILNNYSRQIENSSQEQLIALPRTETASTTVDNTLLHLISTPPCSGHSNVGAKVLSDDLVSTALSTCPANDSGADRILEAKNELLLLIEKFKSGISIESFETIFSDWETKYNDVLEGQMSEELLYSLNQIKMLCALDSISDLDYDDEEEEQCNGSAVDVTKDGDYGEATQESKTQRCSALNELQRTQSTTFAQQMDDDPNGKQLKQRSHAPSHGLIEQCIAFHSKVNGPFYTLVIIIIIIMVFWRRECCMLCQKISSHLRLQYSAHDCLPIALVFNVCLAEIFKKHQLSINRRR